MADGAFPTAREASFGGCCPTPAGAIDLTAYETASERWARDLGEENGQSLKRVDLMAPEIHCGACMSIIEDALSKAPGVTRARVNLSLKRVGVEYRADENSVDGIVGALAGLGYVAKPFDAEALDALRADAAGRELLASLAVAGFAAANVMLLSIAVWAGAGEEGSAATRDLMHWISALIALPAIAFAGRPFFRSAAAALSARRLNMDVPISLAVVLAACVSIFETINSGAHAYFDAAVTLLFFLLIGRYLDHRTRGLARSAAAELAALSAAAATRVEPDGRRREVPIDAIEMGDVVEIAAGVRAPVDGVVLTGRSDLDRSLVTGETAPERVGPGDKVHAGMMNLTGPVQVRVEATEGDTLLAEIARMIDAAERGANKYTRLADRAARVYAPGVHILAGIVFLFWLTNTDGDWRMAIGAASALLIITCPCALALAVPATQATAGGVLFRNGVLVKDGAALEKLSEIDLVVFDKTGTVTLGRPSLARGPDLRPDLGPDREPDDEVAAEERWAIAAALAGGSRHPLSKALAAAAADRGVAPAAAADIVEIAGDGVEAQVASGGAMAPARLGRADWCGAPDGAGDPRYTQVWLKIGNRPPVAFDFEDALREDAAEVVATLKQRGVETLLLSGDRPGPVAATAAALGVDDWAAGRSPSEKLARLEALAAEGRKVLMVGDGINDAPALAAAYASMSPAAGADVSRTAAGLVFAGAKLAPVATAHQVAIEARWRVLENFGLAAAYNAMAIPAAAVGLVTPLIAALAMSGSSIVVTLNALRLCWTERR